MQTNALQIFLSDISAHKPNTKEARKKIKIEKIINVPYLTNFNDNIRIKIITEYKLLLVTI